MISARVFGSCKKKKKSLTHKFDLYPSLKRR